MIDIWHNVLWSRYKGAVFSQLHRLAVENGIKIRFFQIAETDRMRASFTGVDLSYHNYPYQVVFRGPYDGITRWRLMWALAKLVWTSPAQIVVIAGYHKPEYWLQLLISRLQGRQVAVFCDSTAYENPRTPLKSFLKAIFFRSCQRVFCYGERSSDYVRSFGVRAENVIVRCQAAALPANYSASGARASRLEKAPDPSAPPTFLYVGRLATEKGLDDLLCAFSLVRRDSPGSTLRLVGSGPEEASLRALAAEKNLTDYVIFVGALNGDDIFEEYLKATCLILPSRKEPWGLVVNEALSFGCPVIASDHCGCLPELVAEGVTGYSFPVGDVDALARRMLQVVVLARDVAKTTDSCIRQVSPFSSEQAASQIFSGLTTLRADPG